MDTSDSEKTNANDGGTVWDLIGSLPAIAIQSIGVGICLLVFAEIALGLAGGIFKAAIPEPPPGFEGNQSTEAETQGLGFQQFQRGYRDYKFLVWYSVAFLAAVAQRITFAASKPHGRDFASRFLNLWRKFEANWPKIVVGNAIGCFIAASIFVALQQFSFARIVIDIILSAIQPIIYGIAGWFMNSNTIGTIEGFVDWYHNNEMKLTFWVFYASAVMDDMGIPNLKTIAKKLWHLRSLLKRTSRPAS